MTAYKTLEGKGYSKWTSQAEVGFS